MNVGTFAYPKLQYLDHSVPINSVTLGDNWMTIFGINWEIRQTVENN